MFFDSQTVENNILFNNQIRPELIARLMEKASCMHCTHLIWIPLRS